LKNLRVTSITRKLPKLDNSKFGQMRLAYNLQLHSSEQNGNICVPPTFKFQRLCIFPQSVFYMLLRINNYYILKHNEKLIFGRDMSSKFLILLHKLRASKEAG
jgi:hypothetical protein